MKKSLFDLCALTLREGKSYNATNARAALTRVRDVLTTLSASGEEIRLFVAGSINYGHQSTSIVIMNRLIDLGVRRIRIIYEKSTNTNPNFTDEETTVKLTKLIANLTEADIAGPAAFIYRGAELFFNEIASFGDPAPTVTLGISGGFDATANRCKAMRVLCLLVLQPFRYKKAFARNMLYFHPDTYPTQNAFELPNHFEDRGFYIEDPVLPAYLNTALADLTAQEQQIRQTEITQLAEGLCAKLKKKKQLWTDEAATQTNLRIWLEGGVVDQAFLDEFWKLHALFDEEAVSLQAMRKGYMESIADDVERTIKSAMQPGKALSDEWKRKTVQTVLGLLQQPTPAVHVCPVYFSIGRTRFKATTILFNLLTGFFARPNSANENPIVILTMSKFEESIYRMLASIMSGKEEEWDENSTKDWSVSLRKWSPFLCKTARAYMQAKGYFERFKKVKIIHAGDDVASAVTEVGKGGIVLVNLQRVPKPVFEYLYSVSTLPGIFEGEATASLILNLGRPFFHIESSDQQTYSLYPFPVIPGGLVGQQAISEYCLRFSDYFGDKAWSEANKPDEAIARYIQDAYTVGATPALASPLQLYFKSMRAFFHDDLEDKLLQGMLIAIQEMRVKFILPKQ